VRSLSQAQLSHHGTNVATQVFDADPSAKAYLMGFSRGDITATKLEMGSEAIIVRSNTTRTEQIELLRQAPRRHAAR
jgi:hypothetical protein